MANYRLIYTTSFSAAHNLRLYHGKPEPLHGHNWKVEVRLTGQELDGEDMLIDFKEVEEMVESILSAYDYHYINDVPPFDELNSTSENLAREVYQQLSEMISVRTVRVEEVTVWETPACGIAYSE